MSFPLWREKHGSNVRTSIARKRRVNVTCEFLVGKRVHVCSPSDLGRNQHVLVAVIIDCLTKLVGHGGQQAGNFAMDFNAAFRTQNGGMFYER